MDETRAERTATQNADAAPVDTRRHVRRATRRDVGADAVRGGSPRRGTAPGGRSRRVARRPRARSPERGRVPFRRGPRSPPWPRGLACGALLAVAARLPLASGPRRSSRRAACRRRSRARSRSASRARPGSRSCCASIASVRVDARAEASGLVGITIAHSARTFAVGVGCGSSDACAAPAASTIPEPTTTRPHSRAAASASRCSCGTTSPSRPLMDGPEHRDAIDRRDVPRSRRASRRVRPSRARLPVGRPAR